MSPCSICHHTSRKQIRSRLRANPQVAAALAKAGLTPEDFSRTGQALAGGMMTAGALESGALKKAEAMAGRMPGTAAIKVVADDETGELEGATILGQFGEVPDDFAESLQAA